MKKAKLASQTVKKAPRVDCWPRISANSGTSANQRKKPQFIGK